MKTSTRALRLHLLIALIPLCSVSCAVGAPFGVSIRHEPDETNQIVLGWDTVPGRSYNLLSTGRLDPPSWATLNDAPLTAETNRYVFRVPHSESLRFYQVEELKPVAAIAFVGISTQTWLTSDSWVPATQSRIVSGTKSLITLGTWWRGNGGAPLLPTDTSGTFSAAVNPGYPPGESPFLVQVASQHSPAPGLHVVTPDVIGPSGDGFFLLVEAEGLASNPPVADSGHTRIWHPMFGPGDPNTIQSITVATDGSAAQVGDLAVAIIGQDNYEANNQMSLPEGWTSLGVEDSALDNICYRACYKIVTSPGKQSLVCQWVSTSCFVAEAALVIFRAAGNGP